MVNDSSLNKVTSSKNGSAVAPYMNSRVPAMIMTTQMNDNKKSFISLATPYILLDSVL